MSTNWKKLFCRCKLTIRQKSKSNQEFIQPKALLKEPCRARGHHGPDGIHNTAKNQIEQYVLLTQQLEGLDKCHDGHFFAWHHVTPSAILVRVLQELGQVDSTQLQGAVACDAAESFGKEQDNDDEDERREHQKEAKDGSES